MTHDEFSVLRSVIVETFRLNGRLLMIGDKIVADLGLTSARWQVLGAVAIADAPMTVAGIARSMGLTRQAVQRLANEMDRMGLLAFVDNPRHQRAKLVVLTDKGAEAYTTIQNRQRPWANKLAQGMTQDQIDTTVQVLRTLRLRLDEQVENHRNEAA